MVRPPRGGSPRPWSFWRSPWFPLLLLLISAGVFWVLPTQVATPKIRVDFEQPKP